MTWNWEKINCVIYTNSIQSNNTTRSHPEMVDDMSRVTVNPAPIDALYVKTTLLTASLFTFGKFVYV